MALQDHQFALSFSRKLAAQPYKAAFWECPFLSPQRLDSPFESVLLSAPSLASAQASPTAFSQHLEQNNATSFFNLGKDALLVSPPPLGDYGHLLAFCRRGSEHTLADFWAAVGAQAWSLASQQTVWLSTSGLGVPWLHVRLDNRPKYYQYMPYRDKSGSR